MQEITLDGPVLWLLFGLTVTSGVIFGLVPALHGAGGPVDASLRSSGRSSTGSLAVAAPAARARGKPVRRRHAAARGGGTASHQSQRVEAGRSRIRQPQRAHRIDSPAARTVRRARPCHVLLGRDQESSRVAAGRRGVAFADGRPPNDVGNINNFDLEDFPTPPGQSQPVTPWVAVTPEYFRVLGLRCWTGVSSTSVTRSGRTSNPLSWIAHGRERFFPERERRRQAIPAKVDARAVRGRTSSAS